MSVPLLYQGCEALWRDTKYAVMARNYAYVRDLSASLRQARGDEQALRAWLYRLKRVEQEPTTLPALRNTAHHLLGYWKDRLQPEERRRFAQRALDDPAGVIAELGYRVRRDGLVYLATSYVFRDEPWNEAVFRYRGSVYRMTVDAQEALSAGDPSKVFIRIQSLGEEPERAT
ncbi:DUF1722 domain-containing protein [Alicyclobacillus acidocaldarius]|uniref:DUF1722 domain-containing protein n=1 Tax=Alicyclobacillus acidocaldarius (strain Tc-4-1) TaxID=1048834 RepID=F8IGJ2_ALIAT|nr:DUF1722 domain-containing protein [Alicyclobacillus acidocaldarius]AEJ44272.1 hypothetical protein TC41_2372 [Alicyclobacillus acidocaldarius subsp. acidocaldarius Tc-4-1]